MVFFQIAKTLFQLLPALGGVVHVAAMQQVERGQGGATADRIPAESAGVTAARPVHHLRASDNRSQRHPAGYALCQTDNVRLNAPVFDRVHFSGAAHAAPVSYT